MAPPLLVLLMSPSAAAPAGGLDLSSRTTIGIPQASFPDRLSGAVRRGGGAASSRDRGRSGHDRENLNVVYSMDHKQENIPLTSKVTFPGFTIMRGEEKHDSGARGPSSSATPRPERGYSQYCLLIQA